MINQKPTLHVLSALPTDQCVLGSFTFAKIIDLSVTVFDTVNS